LKFEKCFIFLHSMSTENKFEWTDDLVLEFERFTNRKTSVFQGRYTDLEQFKKLKQQNTIQKDWEIHTYKAFNKIYKGVPNPNDTILIVLNNKFTIHSVKRLSDGEVFCIEDVTNFGAICSFYICDEEDSFCYNDMMVCFKEVRANRGISELKKVKQPLFQTFDGINVFEGDEFVAVQKRTFDMICCRHPLTNPEYYYIFSNEEKANNWVLMNKPVLSVNDVQKLFKKETLSRIESSSECGGWRWPMVSEDYDVDVIDLDNLKQLAKSKI